MNNQCKRSVSADKSEVRKIDRSSNNNKEMVRLTLTIDVQREKIDELSSKMSEMEVNFKVQYLQRDDELASLNKKCEEYRLRIEVLEGNSPREVRLNVKHDENVLDASTEEHGSKKKNNEKLIDKLTIESDVTRTVEKCCQTIAKPATTTCQSMENVTSRNSPLANRSEKSVTENQTVLADSCVILSAKLDEKPATTDVVNIVEQKANKAQVVHRNNEPVAVLEDNFNTLNDKKNQCTDNKMNAYLDASPVCALQELCLSRGWTLPKYEFFEESDSKTFTYSVECTLMACTVKVGGLIKREAKRQAATIMYHNVKNRKNGKKLSLKEKSAKCVPANNVGPNGTLADSCVASSARLYEQPVIAATVANNTQKSAKVQVVHKNNEPAVTIKDNTANDIKKQCTDEHFNASPICGLQELCMSRKWSLPVYEFFKEGDNKTFTYSVECRVQTCTVRVEGLIKKEGKRQAASIMYHKVLNI